MKTALQRVIERVIDLRDQAHDDEFSDELDNAVIHLEAAADRLVQLEEEEAPAQDPWEEIDIRYQEWSDKQLEKA